VGDIWLTATDDVQLLSDTIAAFVELKLNFNYIKNKKNINIFKEII